MIKLESKNPSGQCHVVFPKDCIYTFKAKLVPHADLIIADPPYYKVVDPFGGSGSTLLAAEKLGRQAFVMEKDEKYVKAMVERFTSETGNRIIEVEDWERTI